MILRIRSRDGMERISVPEPSAATVSTLRSIIESQLGVPAAAQTLSLDPNLLLPSKASPAVALEPSAPLSSLPLSNGSILYLSYPSDLRRATAAPPPPPFSPAGSFGRRKMTIDDLIARQVRVARQETPHCSAASFDRDAAHAFQLYAADTLAFAVKRAGFLYGRVDEVEHSVAVDFIYEPPQQGSEDASVLFRNPDEEALVEAIAASLGMRRVGFIFTQAVGRKAGTAEYTMSGREVLQAVEMQAEGGIPEWVTAIVKLEVAEDGAADVHFEAFQMSDMCVRLFKEDWFVTEFGEDDDPRVSRMKKDVVVGGKDTKEVDNDFFLVPVKISDHQGPLSSNFPIENRITSVTTKALKTHLERTKHQPFVKRISDFHLLLLLARYLDVNADIPTLAECVQKQASVPDGYQFLIESLAAAV
ncbi:NPL4-like protein isoform X1 [Canna indica]|uniref:NPL4-like protein isoform X1 n=1 Tax=Canna indica TaxID=4628 RepID=A0AAQ3QIB3_9LILI|nr:NPL4-like protein isoform X1 [Canna indica]